MAEWLRRQPAKLMGFARVGSNPTVVDNFLAPWFQVCPCGAMDSASDFGSGGWGFESPLGLFFLFPSFVLLCFLGSLFPRRCNFGRVVKALALGASLERGMGSNPIGCKTYFLSVVRGCSSLGRAVGSQSAGTGIETLLLHHFSTDPYHHVASANGVSVTLKLPKL